MQEKGHVPQGGNFLQSPYFKGSFTPPAPTGPANFAEPEGLPGSICRAR